MVAVVILSVVETHSVELDLPCLVDKLEVVVDKVECLVVWVGWVGWAV